MSGEVFAASVELPVPAAEAFAWHERPGAFERLLPPWERVEILGQSGRGLAAGVEVRLRTFFGPAPVEMLARHTACEPGKRFRDELVRGPFAAYAHEHVFSEQPGGCRLTDEIRYRLPGGPLGAWLASRLVRRRFERLFRYRHAITRADLAGSAPAANVRPRRIALTGSSGLVGSALVPFLATQGHEIVRLVRRPDRRWPWARQVLWDPQNRLLDDSGLEGLEAVVHLAGAGVADARWSDARKREIRASRVESTRLLAATLGRLRRPPATLLCASAVGLYGSRGDAWCDEGTPSGAGFLAEVCREWEAAAAPAGAAGLRVVHLRLGVVLTPAGGALAKMLPAFRAGLGGPVGAGTQWLSWVAIDDVLAACRHALEHTHLHGPVNLVAPNPVTSAAFGAALGRALRRPAILPAPAWALRLAFGAMADETLLASTRVQPQRLLDTAYAFRHPDLAGALSHLLGV